MKFRKHKVGIEKNGEETPASITDMAMFMVGNASSSPIILEFEIESVSLEVDTGAAVSIMSGELFTTQFPNKHLSLPTLITTLKMYKGNL